MQLDLPTYLPKNLTSDMNAPLIERNKEQSHIHLAVLHKRRFEIIVIDNVIFFWSRFLESFCPDSVPEPQQHLV